MSKYVYDENYERFDIEDALTISKGIWSDGNTAGANRVGLFVTSENDINKVSIANANSYVCGVTVENDVFLGLDKDDPKYCIVQSLGVCTVIDDGSLVAGDKCMPNGDGTAMKSSNNLGFRVVSRVDESHVNIIMSPNNDMIQRIENDVSVLNDNLLRSKVQYCTNWGLVFENGVAYLEMVNSPFFILSVNTIAVTGSGSAISFSRVSGYTKWAFYKAGANGEIKVDICYIAKQ